MSKYGAACDNLVSAQLVTVDGKQIEVSRNSNPDLFWAIRGGGGNFGVATALEYRLHPLTGVLAGTLTYPPGRMAELFEALVEFVAAAPDEMNVVGMVLPSEQGTRFQMVVCHCGDPRHGNELLQPLRALKPREDTVRVKSYLEAQAPAFLPAPVAHFQTDLFLPELGAAAIAKITTATHAAPSNTRVFIVPLYGAISRVGVSDMAFPLGQPGLRVGYCGHLDRPGREGEFGAMGQISAGQFAALCGWSVRQPVGRNQRRAREGGVRIELRSPGGDQEKIGPRHCAAAQPEHQAGLGSWVILTVAVLQAEGSIPSATGPCGTDPSPSERRRVGMTHPKVRPRPKPHHSPVSALA